MDGESDSLPFPFIVDVRNIAQAHIQAAITPKAKGQRYLVSNSDTVPNSAVIAVLKERFPGLKFKDAQKEDAKPVLENKKVSQYCKKQCQFQALLYCTSLASIASKVIVYSVADTVVSGLDMQYTICQACSVHQLAKHLPMPCSDCSAINPVQGLRSSAARNAFSCFAPDSAVCDTDSTACGAGAARAWCSDHPLPGHHCGHGHHSHSERHCQATEEVIYSLMLPNNPYLLLGKLLLSAKWIIGQCVKLLFISLFSCASN